MKLAIVVTVDEKLSVIELPLIAGLDTVEKRCQKYQQSKAHGLDRLGPKICFGRTPWNFPRKRVLYREYVISTGLGFCSRPESGFALQSESSQPTARPSSPGKILALGCGAGIVVLIIIAIILQFTWKRMVTSFLRTSVAEQMERSDLPEDERNRVSASVDRLFTAYEEGEIEQEKVQELINAFERSPFSRVAGVYHLKATYLPTSRLDDTEKAAADRGLLRLARGIVEGKVSDNDLESLREQIPRDEEGAPDFNKPIGDESLRMLLENVQKIVDEKGIPDEEYELKVADEIERLVDEVLNGTRTKGGAPAADGGTG